MNIKTATIKYLGELEQPVITDYDLCMTIFNFHQTKKYHDDEIKLVQQYPQYDDIYKEVIGPLLELSILESHKDFPPERVFKILGHRYHYEAGDVVCSVDPFAYLSHLSAMAYHGFTNRLPKMLFISTPPRKTWSNFALKKMEKDCRGYIKDYVNCNLPTLSRLHFDRIESYRINVHSSIHQGSFKHVEGRMLRVSTIGRTFLDMLRRPQYCGGMAHVIDVFSQHGSEYYKLIIDEIDRNGKMIEKSRAGYLLEKCCNIQNDVIEKWAMQVQRGGSRKLDPEKQYSEKYSEKWALSINVD
jgi:predicted transcriptional regulator of viral defense system